MPENYDSLNYLDSKPLYGLCYDTENNVFMEKFLDLDRVVFLKDTFFSKGLQRKKVIDSREKTKLSLR